jgi:uncharacterized protein
MMLARGVRGVRSLACSSAQMVRAMDRARGANACTLARASSSSSSSSRCQQQQLSSMHRHRFSTNANANANEANEEEGKGVANEIAKEAMREEYESLVDEQMLKTHVTGYGVEQFQVNDICMHGSVLLFPRFMLLWAPKTLADITVDSLRPLALVRPKLDLLVLGTGNSVEQLSAPVLKYLDELGVLVETCRSAEAVATFDMLNAEDRAVAAAILACVPNDWDAEELDDYVEGPSIPGQSKRRKTDAPKMNPNWNLTNRPKDFLD